MDFNEKKQACIIIEKLCTQKDIGNFYDIQLVVQGQKFKAHRNVLAACSEYFESIFKKRKVVKEKVTITHCKNVDAFRSLLNYMYSGLIVIDFANVEEMLRLSTRFLIEKVIGYCEVYLCDNMNSSNCFKVRELSTKYKLIELQKNVTSFIHNHIVEVLEQSEMLQFNFKKLEHFLKEKRFHIPQQELLNFICKWLEFDVENREISFQKLLSFVNWPSINPAYLEENINAFMLLENSSKCLFHLLSVLEDHNINLCQYEEKFLILKQNFGAKQPLSKEIDDELCNTIDDIGPEQSLSPSTERESALTNKLTNNYQDIDAGIGKPSKSSECISLKNKKPRKSTNPRKFVAVSKSTSRKKSLVKNSPYKQLYKKKVASEEESEGDQCSGNGPSNESDTSSDYEASARKIKSLRQPAKCVKCSYVAINSIKLQQHVSKVHKKDIVFKCKVCEFTCTWIREYNSHMKLHYNGPPFKCDECSYVSQKIYLLLAHLARHTDARPFACDQCRNKYRTQYGLDIHLRTHTGERPYPCDQCERRFNTKRLLSDHLSTHRNDKPFLCDTCGYSTKLKKRLSYHLRVHSGQVIYCDFPDCKFSAPWKSEVVAHQKTHTGIRSFVCSFCGAGFVAKNYLLKHERIHLNENPFKCDKCDYSSCRKDKLKEHVQKHHSGASNSHGPFRSRKLRVARINDEQPKVASNTLQPISTLPVKAPCLESSAALGSNNSSNCNSESQPNIYYNALSVGIGYECLGNTTMAMQQLGTVHNYQLSNLQSVGSNIAPAVPTISQEIPSKFRSFMSFM